MEAHAVTCLKGILCIVSVCLRPAPRYRDRRVLAVGINLDAILPCLRQRDRQRRRVDLEVLVLREVTQVHIESALSDLYLGHAIVQVH